MSVCLFRLSLPDLSSKIEKQRLHRRMSEYTYSLVKDSSGFFLAYPWGAAECKPLSGSAKRPCDYRWQCANRNDCWKTWSGCLLISYLILSNTSEYNFFFLKKINTYQKESGNWFSATGFHLTLFSQLAAYCKNVLVFYGFLGMASEETMQISFLYLIMCKMKGANTIAVLRWLLNDSSQFLSKGGWKKLRLTLISYIFKHCEVSWWEPLFRANPPPFFWQ